MLVGLTSKFVYVSRTGHNHYLGQILTVREFEMEQVIYDKLQAVARAHGLTNYTEMGTLVGLGPHDSHLWAMLDEINRFEHKNNRPMISALCRPSAIMGHK